MKSKRSVAAVLAVMLAFLCVSCTAKTAETADDNAESADAFDFSRYRIIYPDTASEELAAAAYALGDAINAAFGTDVEVHTDWDYKFVADDDEIPTEILIGKTNRSESGDMPFYAEKYDSFIGVRGEKVVINGGGDFAVVTAVRKFTELYITNNKGVTSMTEDTVYRHEYKSANVTINGAGLSQFKVVYGDNSVCFGDAADKIEYLTGVRVERGYADDPDGGYYIVLDNTALTYYDYGVSISGGCVRVTGGYNSYGAALECFMAMLERGGDITDSDSVTGSMERKKLLYNSKEELLAIYKYVSDNNLTMYGEHMGGGIEISAVTKRFRDAVGDGPVIIDCDLLNFPYQTKLDMSRALKEAVDFAAQGGIITTMCHWTNPNEALREGKYRGSIGTRALFDELFIEGSELNAIWKKQLDLDASFFGALRDAGVCVTYRPLHEANGNWFWFCAIQPEFTVSEDDMVKMWRYVYDYYTVDKGLDNLLWTYSPNVTNSTSPLPVDYYYPGDGYCDLVGLDWYTGGGYEVHGEGKSYETIMSYGKPAGFAEWGTNGGIRAESPEKQAELFNCGDVVKMLEKLRMWSYNVCYLEAYSEMFGAAYYLGEGHCLDECDFIVLLDDMPEIVKKATGK